MNTEGAMYNAAASVMQFPAPSVSAALAAALEEAHRSGQRAWPGVAVTAEAFATHVAGLLPPGAAELPPRLCTDDLFLACACVHGDLRAVDFFSTRILSSVPAAVARVSTSSAFVEDLQQTLREVLLVGRAGSPPRIGEYRGTGPLAAWVRVTAVRTAIRMKQREERAVLVDDAAPTAIAPTLGPEVEYLKGRYRPIVADALRRALARLEDRDREMLRQHYVDGLSIDELGARHGVHRATAARWVVAARERLLKATRDLAAEWLRADADEVDGLLQLVASQLELSMRSLDDR
jgi:RNA polymerase sigma-70 factor (ECF subfamily)